jgi:hypothetical protein
LVGFGQSGSVIGFNPDGRPINLVNQARGEKPIGDFIENYGTAIYGGGVGRHTETSLTTF